MLLKNISYYSFIAIIGLLIASLIFFITKTHIHTTHQQEFDHLFSQQVNLIQKEVDINIDVLESLGSLFKTNNNISREQFKKFVTRPLGKHKSLQALEWIPKIKHDERQKYEEKASRELNIKYKIKRKLTSGEIILQNKKSSYYPVYYVEPLLGNEKALGFDLASDKIRFNSLIKSKNTKKIMSTSGIKLVQEKENQFGILLYLPVWESSQENNLKGFVLAVLRIGDTVKTALSTVEHTNKLVDFWLTDSSIDTKSKLLYTNTNRKTFKTENFKNIHIEGRVWTLFAQPSSVLEQQNHNLLPFSSSLLSLIIFCLIAYILKTNLNKTEELKQLIYMKTNDLKIVNENLKQQINKGIDESRKKDEFLAQQAKLAAMGEMMGNIAHQWRQPLNILGALNLKAETFIEIHGQLSKNHYSNISKNIEVQLNYMSKTIDDFRNFFRSDKTKKDFYILEYINKSLNILNTQLEYLNIDIEITGDDFVTHGLENEFQQVILNVVNNAKDALIENDIKNGKIHIKTQILDSSGIISIQDNAGGISDNVINRIFEPYYTTKEKSKGTGVGLYMSKIIVEDNMNGQISAFNVNNGACFIIQLNVQEEST